jgi:hypothetical protein
MAKCVDQFVRGRAPDDRLERTGSYG